MNENNSNSDMKKATTTPHDYEAIVQKLAFAAIKEQRSRRRWRTFFIFLTFLYLTPLLLVSLGMNGVEFFDKADKSTGKHTALIRMSGIIAAEESAGSEIIIESLNDAFEDKDTKGVILEINSPGGSPVQSADIYEEIVRLRKEYDDIPLHVVVSDVAASGGYFVASAADNIYVNKSSLVGSIGVRMDSFGAVDLIKKIGIERRLLTAGEHKGLLDPFLPPNKAETEHVQKMLDQVHQHFINAVKSGRGQRLKDNKILFSGLIWTGEEAIKLGLVDAYGSTQYVAREVIKEEEIVDFTTQDILIDRLAKRLGASIGYAFGERFQNQFDYSLK